MFEKYRIKTFKNNTNEKDSIIKFVEAIQFTNENKNQVYYQAGELQNNIYPAFENGLPCLKIPTVNGLEEEMTCFLGDYLIKGNLINGKRKLYPCSKEIFEKDYKKI